jgi:16S rRNA processing protein RimM
MSTLNAELVKVGVIVGAHGIRWAVKIVSFTADPAAIARYGTLRSGAGLTIDILRMKPAKDVFIADIKGITDRNQAEALKGTDLFVPRENLPEPEEGDSYLHDLVGKPVMAGDAALGEITGFQNFGAGELMELADGLLIPLAFMTKAGETVEVTLPDGFLDDDDTPPGRGGRP